MPATLIIDVDREGNAKVRVEGVTGAACTDLAKGIEEALGRIENVTPTSDFYRSVPRQQKAGGK